MFVFPKIVFQFSYMFYLYTVKKYFYINNKKIIKNFHSKSIYPLTFGII